MINFLLIPFIGLLIFLAVMIFFTWIWAIIDCLKSESSGEYKLLWLLVIIFLNFLGAIIYFLFADSTKERKMQFSGKQKGYLTRSSENKMIGGVCGGLAEHFSIDPAILRIIWILFAIFVNGVAIILYIIAWIAIPLDTNIKHKPSKEKQSEKGQKTTNKKATMTKKEGTKTKQNRRLFANITLGLLVFCLLISFIASFLFLGNAKYDNFEQATIKNLNVELRSEINEKIILDEIMSSTNYKNFNGQELRLLEIKEPEDDSCVLFQRDPYGLKVYDSGCKEFIHIFLVDSETIGGYHVNTLTTGGRIVKMTFTSFTKEENLPQEELLVNNCTTQQKKAEVCMAMYDPVCGFATHPSSENTGETYSNACHACVATDVQYWTPGECDN